jgi:anti-sigma factor RsiW
MNRCDQARRLFGSYWDDEVTQAEREWLESHLAGCPGCRQQYEQLARTLETVGSLPRTDVAADLPERALQAARRATAAPDRIAVAPARPAWIPVTAAAALFLLGASSLLPWLGTPAGQRLFAQRESHQTTEPKLVALKGTPAPPTTGATATLADSLFDHSEDVEFILDPVVLHRGRAQAPSRLPKGVQGEQAVISF